MKIILASASPRRQELLRRIYPQFDIIPADIDETVPEDIGMEFAPVFLSAEKAAVISDKHPDALVIAADTIVIINDIILGKPRDDQDACEMLRTLSGNTHKVITGCSVRFGEISSSFSVESLVTFYELEEEEISKYVNSGSSKGKAGAYGIQDTGSLFVERIDGDYYNIVGLPIARLNREIKHLLSTTEQN